MLLWNRHADSYVQNYTLLCSNLEVFAQIRTLSFVLSDCSVPIYGTPSDWRLINGDDNIYSLHASQANDANACV